MNHRDHINAVRAKRIWTDLKDEEAERIQALLEAAQKAEFDKQQSGKHMLEDVRH